ncbi:MAG: OmpA family protein [Gemmatimonadota bacterium]
MRHGRQLLIAMVAMLSAAPLAAQRGGAVEIGAFGRWTKFGDPLATDVTNHLPAKNGAGFGGRLGIFLFRNMELEADISHTKVDAAGAGGDHVTIMPIHAGLTYNVPLGSHSAFLLGGRYVHNKYGKTADYTDHGLGAVAGLRLGIVRVEATMDWMKSDLPAHEKYRNFGVNAGLSLLLGNGCDESGDGVTVTPGSVTLERGATANFSAVALHCGKPRDVTWTATGGEISATGMYTAGSTPGNYTVTATEPKEGLTGTATVTIKAPPPPPPPVTLQSIDLKPDNARAKVNEPVMFTVSASMSDGTTKPMPNCQLTATGNAKHEGNSFSWGRYGEYTVTATCDGKTDQSAVEVPLEVVIYGTNFAFDKDVLTAAGRDSVRAAADSLKLYPDIKVRLGGFADFVGSDEYNCALSWRRAHTVERTLLGFGVAADQISLVEGFGEAYPIPDAQVPQAWVDINTRTHDKGKWWDRRVDITSARKGAGMTACAEPASSMRSRP